MVTLRVLSHLGQDPGIVGEQTPVEDDGQLTAVLDRLRARGALVAVDDTGSGYASLRHLLALRPQFVKLDRALVSGVDHDPALASAIAAIGAFAGELDAWLVAEGVETESELDRLLELNVPLVQGYLLGRPNPAMAELSGAMASHLRGRRELRRRSRLAAVARPAPLARVVPDLVATTTVLVDGHDRPLDVLVPSTLRRHAVRHPAMCVQANDDVVDVALRAGARPAEHRLAPLCLCDELGRARGVVPLDALLETLAREHRRG